MSNKRTQFEWNPNDEPFAPFRLWAEAKICTITVSDIFAPECTTDAIDAVYAIMAICPIHEFRLVTTHKERMKAYLKDSRIDWNHSRNLQRRICNAAGRMVEDADLPEEHPARIEEGMLYDMFTQDEDGEYWPLPNVKMKREEGPRPAPKPKTVAMVLA